MALAGWLFLFVASEPIYICLGTGTLAAGLIAYLLWSRGMGRG
jgi:hypothetical protein